MVKITLGRYIVSGNDIEEPVDLMTQNINPSKISPYLKNLNKRKETQDEENYVEMFPEKYLKRAKEYQNNEYAWIKNLFSTIKKRTFSKDATRQRKISLGHYDLHFTKEQFIQAWEDHKKKYGGMYCGYSGEAMTHMRSNIKDPLRNQSTNISVDRIDPEKPYTLK
jgi:membrane-associated HD superfamily phosphohydrolase